MNLDQITCPKRYNVVSQPFLGCNDKVLWVAFEASEVKVEIGKHDFKSCEETASNPDQDPRSRL